MSVSMVKRTCSAISFPWSHVSVRRRSVELGQLAGERKPHVLSSASVGQVHQHNIAAPAFDQSSDRRAAALSDDQVTLPMARNGAVGGLGGTVADHDHVLQSTGA